MQAGDTKPAQSSKISLYRGLIALAWADHELHVDEKTTLHEIINTHKDLSTEDRALLAAEVDKPVALADVWPDITNPQDRARLIDMANIIFQQDGDYCGNEQELIERFQAKHLSSIGVSAIQKDLSAFSAQQAEELETERAKLKAWASQYGLMGRIKSLFA